jgi:hypothetical protein
MLARQGKSVTVVDHNPVSFDIAKRFFGLPKEIPCVVADFREYLLSETRIFDGIAIGVGGPGFCFEEQFDPATCHSITARLKPSGRAILNMLVATDFDAAPDMISSDLSEGHMTSWIFDHPECPHRLPAEAAPGRQSALHSEAFQNRRLWLDVAAPASALA